MSGDIALKLKPAEFASDQDVRWCPGCGDYAVLKAAQKMAASSGISKEDFVFVSGIGCAARFPYYMDTYGAHTLHGRATSFATGVKLANPDLSLWVVSGDGDLLSIGGNHTMHTMRRNVDINIILLNNRIYGLTKGQYSPTSELGKVTKSTPLGSPETPLNPMALAVAAGCTFMARCVDVDVAGVSKTLDRAAKHRGTAFIEIYQDCNVFNHAVFFYASKKDERPRNTIELEHGKPLIFGENSDRGLIRCGERIEIVELGGDVSEDDLIIHDEKSRSQAFMLSQLAHPDYPEPMGVFFADDSLSTYDDTLAEQDKEASRRYGEPDLAKEIAGWESWTVE